MITVVGNLKGGTGKSTVAFNLALWLAFEDRLIQVCDLDPQGTLRDALDVREDEGFDPVPEVLAKLPAKPQGEVIVDVGLSGLEAMNNALTKAARILIPVAPSQADVWATQRFLGMVDEQLAGKKKPEMIAFINRGDTHPQARETDEALEALHQLKGIAVLDHRLGQRTAFRRSFSEGLAVFELEPSSKAAEEIDALALAVFGDKK